MSDAVTLVSRFLAGIGEGRWLELADFYADDVVVDQPFSAPSRLRIVGREAVREHFAAAAQRPMRLVPGNIVIHTTSDPEVVIAEFDYDVENTATGGHSTVANVQLFRIRDGRFVETRDYHDHLRLAAAFGRAGALAAALD